MTRTHLTLLFNVLISYIEEHTEHHRIRSQFKQHDIESIFLSNHKTQSSYP